MIYAARRLILVAVLAFADRAGAQAIAGYADLHIHIGAHLAVPVYGTGPDAPPTRGRTHAHALVRQLTTDELAAPGPTVLVSLAYANPFSADFESRRSMAARIERQLTFVDAWALAHAEHFAVARTPEEAREIVRSGRKAILHGIEGATKLLDSQADAERWAARGVAVITPVHLADNRFGGAWCQSGPLALLNVPGCLDDLFAPRLRGLTRAGADAVDWLVRAGIVVDLAHLSHAAFADALGRLEAAGVAPVYTHVTAAAVRAEPNALTDEELRRFTAAGGLAGLTAALGHMPPRPAPAGRVACAGSLDDFRAHWDHVVGVLGGAPLAWGSDFQGGVDHLRPKYGPRGCEPAAADATEFDALGLARADLVEPMFAALAAAGSDRAPLDVSAEQLLKTWERARRVGGEE
ncbi:MAG: hypothetical protein EXR71_02690 [Myxococcales bacterium]|nr:hypothetical protein [Myxococcales bacterium]